MSNDVTTYQPGAEPPQRELANYRPPGAMADMFASEYVTHTLASLSNELRGSPGHELIARLPTADERRRIHARQQDLRVLLRPASESGIAAVERISAALGDTLGGWLNLRGINLKDTVAGFTAKLQELPSWAVCEACRDFQEGIAYETIEGKSRPISREFAPSEAMMFSVARAKLTDLMAEADLIRRIMGAKLVTEVPESPEERERVGELLKGLAKAMGARNRASQSRDAARARREAEAAAARRKRIIDDANERRLARYAELRLHLVYSSPGVLWDPDALPAKYQFSTDEPMPDQAGIKAVGLKVLE